MRGEAQRLIQFFDGSDKRFIIPLYQRNYDWKEKNCEQLFRDLMKLHKSGRKNHFFGSIVSSIDSGSGDRYIIDGQQRITTVSLLLIAMINANRDGLIEAKESRLVDKILNCYLVDQFRVGERKIKLKPIKKDMQAFDALLYSPKDQYVKGSQITRNYEFFYDKIIKSHLTIDDLLNVIMKLEVININLEKDDDPQLIFESLNSTGLNLSEADKIRNYLLMSLSPSEQKDLYTRYWNPIEEYTNYEPSSFVRDYLTMKQGKIGRIDQIYFVFKEYAEEKCDSRAQLLEDLHHYAKIYSQIDKAQLDSERLNRKIRQLRTLESTIAYPFYMAFFDYATEKGLSENEKYDVIDVIEGYWARRIICNLPSNAMNKVFATLHRDVLNRINKSAGENPPSYISVLTYVLLNKGRSSVFPVDEEVKEDFCTRQIYKMPSNTCMFIMERMENRDSKECHDVVNEHRNKSITIEHIMPQTLSVKWKAALGEDWERIHQQYLHTMANLTLTGYNSQYSNLTFEEKRDMEKGFKDSAFRLNNYVKSCEKWTEEELKQRQKELLSVFMKLWPMPMTSYVPKVREVESASLDDDDFVFTGKKLQAYYFRGARYPVNNWKDMLAKICQYFIMEKRSVIEWMCDKKEHFFATSSDGGKKHLDSNIYLWMDNNTSTKIAIIRGIFDECDIPYSDLVFEFRTEAEGEEE
ncbi:MAG: DUF262 domain-containing HNH endonuclease family protein [Prevotellaceae bacterium]|nr:DUF262 domain-containing HNH endonuclease family protein [Prevotellaceae bacterium]